MMGYDQMEKVKDFFFM